MTFQHAPLPLWALGFVARDGSRCRPLQLFISSSHFVGLGAFQGVGSLDARKPSCLFYPGPNASMLQTTGLELVSQTLY